MTPIVLVIEPAKNPTIAKQPYRAPLAASVRATLELIEPPAPRPDKALNIPGQHKLTKPSSTICTIGVAKRLEYFSINMIAIKKGRKKE